MCYTVPLVGAMVTSCIWKKNKSVKTWWLNLMFWGGGLFGFIDHLWNGELFFISPSIWSDLLLGVVISFAIVAIWAVVLAASKYNHTLADYTAKAGN